jgi:hypothetical protein
MIHGILFSAIILLLLVYSVGLTIWAARVKKHCECGAAHGSFHPIVDKPLHIFRQLDGDSRLARRWGDKEFGILLETPQDGI